MLYVAFTLGLFGSLHCVGMCGPLAIAFTDRPHRNTMEKLYHAMSYNVGRTLTYALIGSLFGLLGSMMMIVDFQKALSIILGSIMVLSFLLSVDVEAYLNNSTAVKRYYGGIRSRINKMMQKSRSYHPFSLGMANGLLPCGLVYVALAGSLATGQVFSGFLFMVAFGLGTVPMLLALIFGYGYFSPQVKRGFRKMLPFVSLSFGLFLIYRGVAVDMPTELDFWEALKNPIMCH